MTYGSIIILHTHRYYQQADYMHIDLSDHHHLTTGQTPRIAELPRFKVDHQQETCKLTGLCERKICSSDKTSAYVYRVQYYDCIVRPIRRSKNLWWGNNYYCSNSLTPTQTKPTQTESATIFCLVFLLAPSDYPLLLLSPSPFSYSSSFSSTLITSSSSSSSVSITTFDFLPHSSSTAPSSSAIAIAQAHPPRTSVCFFPRDPPLVPNKLGTR
ncbi:uncharacterized protein BP01DRAFT_107558 [Aspergillus saccharolyticus JOP 1030-1]|uniref:Uncharacterized protein n=1 Tax=Aspergillus saccharolyticus JOP 1030-1 TaxID=1450539 RepID=A0A318ZAD3_9EURO|nr:hypothetical protein BP01DRAFT_107558 [Aspergillus saccharolyticus JOP 1030-1]PYH43284.1 hypothetical protein BP01DRAFT_107558 [Aspergillus saccharolyticus JOP 1030-1]